MTPNERSDREAAKRAEESVRHRKRDVRIALGVLALVAAVVLISIGAMWALSGPSALRQTFEKIEPGMGLAEVQQLLDSPGEEIPEADVPQERREDGVSRVVTG